MSKGYLEKYTPFIERDMKIACLILNVNFEDLVLIWPNIREQGAKEEAETRLINAQARMTEIESNRMEAGEDQNLETKNGTTDDPEVKKQLEHTKNSVKAKLRNSTRNSSRDDYEERE